MVAKEAVAGVNVIDVAALAVVANELEITLLAQLAVPNNELVIPPLVILILPDNTLSEPVTRTDPLTIALPVNGNVGGAKLALVAKDAVPVNGPRNNDADTVVANIDPVTINPDGNVTDPVKYDADTALVAQLDVPINVPVNEPVKLPVLICVDEDTNPLGNIVGAKEAVVAKLAVVANDAVPNIDPL